MVERNALIDLDRDPLVAPPPSGERIRIDELLKADGERHRQILRRLTSRIELSERFFREKQSDWDRVDEHMHMFVDFRRQRRRSDGKSASDKEMPFDNGIVVPISYAILHVRLTALMTIFLARDPIIQIRGNGPEDVRAAEFLESLLAYDLRRTKIPLVLYSIFQDAEKYGIGIIADQWDQEFGHKVNRSVEEMAGRNPLFRITLEQNGLDPRNFERKEWGLISEGNKLRAVDPRLFYSDPRVETHDVQNMEYVGDLVNMNRMKLIEKSMENSGPYFNLEAIKRIGNARFGTREGFGRNSTGEHPFRLNTSSANLDRDVYDVSQLQIRLIPREWGLGQSNRPEIWWFALANKQVIIRAHRNPYDHNQFGYATLQSNIDVHNNNNPGTLTNLLSINSLANWMYSSHIENTKRFLNDAFIFAPSYFDPTNITNPGPARHIALSELGERYIQSGGNINSLLQQLPTQDVTGQHLGQMSTLFDLANRMTGVNDPAMGIPTRSKRTLGEINNVLSTSSRRVSLTAQIYDVTALSVVALRMIANRQQFTTQDQYIELLGKAAEREGAERFLVNRGMIQGNFNYTPITGITPPEPTRAGQFWIDFLGAIAQFPGIEQVINFQAVFKEMIQKQGIRNVEDFLVNPTENIVDEEEIEQQVQQGNMIPNPAEPSRIAA